jgi:hypothetical protein
MSEAELASKCQAIVSEHHNPSDLLCVEPEIYEEARHKLKVPF